jgi:hypothetical protein
MKHSKNLAVGAAVLGVLIAVVGTVVFFGVGPASPPSDLLALRVVSVVWPVLLFGGILGFVVLSVVDRRG